MFQKKKRRRKNNSMADCANRQAVIGMLHNCNTPAEPTNGHSDLQILGVAASRQQIVDH